MVAPLTMQRVGKYQLIRKLATGGMAEVFLARAEGPMGFAKRLVVKRILPHFVEDPNFVGMFLGEAKLAAELNHPNLVSIFDFGEADGQYYLAMEYIDGPNLRQLNVASRQQGKPLSYSLSARLMTFAAEGLHAAHELRDEHGQLVNLVHRDISPDNILLSRNGTVKVIDFGIAKLSTEPSRTKSGVIKGKLAYMPPEQLSREPLDRRADIFALGVVLYELIAGAMPFDATSEVSIIQAIMNEEPLSSVRSKVPDVPQELDAIVATCLSKNAADRYPTCKALQNALEHFIAAQGVPVFTSDLAAVIDAVVPAVAEVSPAPSGSGSMEPLDSTVATRPKHRRSKEVVQPATEAEGNDPELSRGSAPTHARGSVVRATPKRPFVAVVVLLVVGIGIGGLAVFRPWEKWSQPVRVPLPEALKHPPVAVVPVAVEPVAVVPVPARETEEADAAVPEAAVGPVAAVPVKLGHLELRIRPFALVFLDGKPMGQTPLPPLALPVGKHRLRLVNDDLAKNIEQDIVVRAGENTVFKLNLKE